MKKIKIEEVRQIINLIKISKKIFITGHINPDGDVLGSSLSLYLGIEQNFDDKIVDICFEDLPQQYAFLPKYDKIKIFGRKNFENKLYRKYDLGIILECSEKSRVGKMFDYLSFEHLINIDHHQNHNNSINSKLSVIYPEYASCAEIIFDIFELGKMKMNKDIAICLYTGIVTDTGMFQWSNTNEHSFYTAFRLCSYGVEPYYIYKNIYRQKSYNSLLLLGKVLSTLQVVRIKRYNIGSIYVTKKMLNEAKATLYDTEDFINFPMDIKDVSISIFFKEIGKNKYKVSFRSDSVDVEKIARYWSGGGHKYAAGATICGSLNFVKSEVFEYLKKVL
jgi:phosphoesterase RecJ-like protein